MSVAAASPLTSPTVSRDWEANERVRAVIDAGSVLYVGGTFTSFTDGYGTTVSRSRLAAIDPVSGEPTAFNVSVNGPVHALELTSDGSTLYVGGEFTSVGGLARANAAAISLATGSVTAWNPKPNRAVLAIESKGTTIYLGGAFTKIDTTDRLRIAAVTSTGALVSGFTASTDQAVNDLQFSASGTTLMLGGNFRIYNGAASKFMARINPTTGARYAWQTLPGVGLLSLTVESGTVFAGGRGSGGRLYAFDIATGQRLWWRGTDGDVQAVAVSGGVVYVGGHFQMFNGVERQHAVAVRGSDALDLNWQVWTNGVLGVWALTARPDRVVLGGDFTKVNYLSRTAHLARIT